MYLKRMKRACLTIITCLGTTALPAQQEALKPYEDSGLPVHQRVADLMSRLSVEDKVNLLIGTGMPEVDLLKRINPVVGSTDYLVAGCAGTTTPLEAYGLPAMVMTDGPAGVRISPIRKGSDRTYYATGFPTSMSVACSWNVDLARQLGEAIGQEALEYGSDVQLAPAINIMRNPLCGRNYEYYSEDPWLTGKMAAAYISGIQENGVAASVKHFAANNNETNRMEIDVQVSQRALREIYLRGFEIAVKEAKPATVMSSYNRLNGVYTSANYDLLTTVLRDEWGFQGVVMTDWFGGYAGYKSFRGEYASVTLEQIQAGNDLLMPGITPQKRDLLEGIKAGKLSMTDVDVAVKRILTLLFRSPRMNRYPYSDNPDLKAHTQIARQAAAEGMVLLKNEGGALPLAADVKRPILFGSGSYNFISGGDGGSGCVHMAYTVSLLEGMQRAGFSRDEELCRLYLPFLESEHQRLDAERKKYPNPPALTPAEYSLKNKIIGKKAATGDIAIITIGRSTGEFFDWKPVKGDYLLSDAEQELIDDVSRAFHAQGKKVVVVLNIGNVIETASWQDKVDAILVAWLGGQEGGNAVVDVLTGKTSPSGKLSMTFPMRYEDVPYAAEFPGVTEAEPQSVGYKEGVYVGYRYFDSFGVKPAFAFGHGLSYASFEYSAIELSDTSFNRELFVTADIKNTGKCAAREVVQLYLCAPGEGLDKPARELKGFAKTRLLQPGETQRLTFRLTARELASFHSAASAWVADEGDYVVELAASSADIRQKMKFHLPKRLTVEKVNDVLKSDGRFSDMKRF